MVVVTSFCYPDSEIIHEQKNTKVLLDKRDLGTGTLFISERTLSWKEEGNNGFSIQYPHITLHAISSDTSVYPQQCVYVMIDTHISLPGGVAQPEHEGSDSDSEADISELIIAPEDSGSIQYVYDALKSGQALNPEHEEGDDLEADIFEDADEGDNDELPSAGFIGGGGDADMENLSNQLRHNYVTVYSRPNHANGQQSTNGDNLGEDELFEDAD